jgi:hypothetical protein
VNARDRLAQSDAETDPQWAQVHALTTITKALLEFLNPADDALPVPHPTRRLYDALAMDDNETAAADCARDGQTPNT